MLTEKEIEIFLKEQNIFYKIEVEEEERAIILETGDNDFSDGEIQIVLEKNKINFVRVDYGFIRFIETIDNNIIEFKHYLQNHKKDIEITLQDIIDWLNTILKINEDGEYSIIIPPSFSQVLVEILDDKTIEIKTSLMFKDKKEREEHLILLANNSNDYWKLYNIIKNLKG